MSTASADSSPPPDLFDVNAIPALQSLIHLPALADPSHGTGRHPVVAAIGRSIA